MTAGAVLLALVPLAQLDIPEIRLAAIAPELSLVVSALAILIVDAIVPSRFGRWYLPYLSTLALGIAIAIAVASNGSPEVQLAGMVVLDGFATFIKVTLGAFGLLTVWLGREYLVREGIEESEFYGLVLFAVAGMMLMASAADLIVVFIALETFSIALYVLVAFRRLSPEGQESSLKYFLLGAFSSAFFLLGIALAYGAVGATRLYPDPAGATDKSLSGFLISNPSSEGTLLTLALGLLLIGLGFKIAAVPFHMWTPDAYQGAPSPVTGFMAAGSKIAGFAALIRLVDSSLFSLRWEWRPLLIAVAVLTMMVGSVLAVVQDDVKRLLAYSSIAHAGFVLTGVIAVNDDGVSGSLFYLATYGVTVLGAFAVVSILAGREEQRVRIEDYRGLFYESPLLAGALTLFLLSLAGVPLTAGFAGKLVVFGSAIEAGYSWVVVVGVIASAIAVFFYLRILVAMYMQTPEREQPKVGAGWLAYLVVLLSAAATIAFGIYFGPLIDAAQEATFAPPPTVGPPAGL